MAIHAMVAGRVLVVDDTDDDRQLLERLLVADGYAVTTAADGESGLRAVTASDPDVILLDLKTPGMTGLDVCRRLKGDPATRLIPVVLISQQSTPEDRVMGIHAGADDLMPKPANPVELRARIRSLVHLKQFRDEHDSAEHLILNLALAIEARDPLTAGHCERVAAYATALGISLELPDDVLATLHRGGFLHDVGQLAVPEAVLLKPGPLTPKEFEQIRQHPVVGDRLCGELRVLRAVRPIVRSHHERLDGSGYPDGLRGEAVPLPAQVLSIADAYDAMTTARPYRAARTPTEAVDILRQDVQHGWRRGDLVETFAHLAASGQLRRLARNDLPEGVLPPSRSV